MIQADSHAATELELYLMNTSDAYEAYYLPLEAKLFKMRSNSTYSLDKALRMTTTALQPVAQQYMLEYGGFNESTRVCFPKHVRALTAEAIVEFAKNRWDDEQR